MFRVSSPCPSLLCRHVLFGFSASELAVVPRVFVYLLNLAKYFLWRARNNYRLRAVYPGALLWLRLLRPGQSATFASSLNGSGRRVADAIFTDRKGVGVFILLLSLDCVSVSLLVFSVSLIGCTGLPSCLSECVCGFFVAFVRCTGSPSILSVSVFSWSPLLVALSLLLSWVSMSVVSWSPLLVVLGLLLARVSVSPDCSCPFLVCC